MFSWITEWYSRRSQSDLASWPESDSQVIVGQDEIRPPLSFDVIAVLGQSARIARRFKHEYLGTEHLLRGLVESGLGVSTHVLGGLGITAERLQQEIDQITQPGAGWELRSDEPLPLTPRCESAVRLAAEEADLMTAPAVTADHLFLGLLREPEGVAYQVLTNLALEPIGVRDCVLAMMRARPSAVPGGTHMYERFTDRARKVMQLANQEAQRFNHEYIGTEHILLGLVKEGSGVAANVLKNLDVSLKKIKAEIERIVQRGAGGDQTIMGRLPHTPRSKRVIEFAIEEARHLNHNYVGTEHLLLGLLREREGVAAQVLMNLGLRMENLRQEVLNLLGQAPLSDSPPVVLHQIDSEVMPPAAREPTAPLPADFAALDAVIANLTDVRKRAISTQKLVKVVWYSEQLELLRQVREAILRRWKDQQPPEAAP